MFTGIIEELGTLVDRIEEGTSLRLQFEAERVFFGDGSKGPEYSENGLKIDDSIAVNGVCQTVVSVQPPIFEVIAVQETLQKTTLGSLIAGKDRRSRTVGAKPLVGAKINLERAATLQTRLGGHLVQGHVDGRARLREVRDLNGSWEFYFELPHGFAQYVVPQGSVTLDGVSLTVAEVVTDRGEGVEIPTSHSLPPTIKVAIIPHTYYHTNFQYLKVGDEVNIEFDILAKMVERLMKPQIR